MKNFKKGFTLVEMLIVVVIIGILAAAILPRLTGAQAATRDVARQKSLNDLASGLEMYTASQGTYPDANDAGSAEALKDPLVTQRGYLKDIPTDPQAKSEKIVLAGSLGGEQGKFAYVPLAKNGNPNTAYALVAKVETIDKANADKSIVATIGANTDMDTVVKSLCTKVKMADTTNVTTKTDCALKADDMYMVVVR